MNVTIRGWSFWFQSIPFFINCLWYFLLSRCVSFDHGIGMIFHLKYPILVWKRYDLPLKFGMKMVWFSVILVWSQYWQQWVLKSKLDPRRFLFGKCLINHFNHLIIINNYQAQSKPKFLGWVIYICNSHYHPFIWISYNLASNNIVEFGLQRLMDQSLAL